MILGDEMLLLESLTGYQLRLHTVGTSTGNLKVALVGTVGVAVAIDIQRQVSCPDVIDMAFDTLLQSRQLAVVAEYRHKQLGTSTIETEGIDSVGHLSAIRSESRHHGQLQYEHGTSQPAEYITYQVDEKPYIFHYSLWIGYYIGDKGKQ